MNLATKIKEYRKEKNLTQKALSEKMGVSSRTIQNYESGDREPDIKTLYLLAKNLNIDIKDFFTDDTNKISNDYLSAPSFTNPLEAMEFIVSQPPILKYGGLDLDKLSEQDIIDLANDLLIQFELVSHKYKK